MTNDLIRLYQHGRFSNIPTPDWFERAVELSSSENVGWHHAVTRAIGAPHQGLTIEATGPTGVDIGFWRSLQHGVYVEIASGLEMIEQVLVRIRSRSSAQEAALAGTVRGDNTSTEEDERRCDPSNNVHLGLPKMARHRAETGNSYAAIIHTERTLLSLSILRPIAGKLAVRSRRETAPRDPRRGRAPCLPM